MPARNASPPAASSDDHDSLWKEALELYFSEAMALLAPDLHATIDWLVPVEFLDKELQAVLRASAPAQGRRHADKLARVRLLGGTDALLLVHVEVQGRLSSPQALQVFGWRMLEYSVLFRQRERRRGKTLLPPQVYSLGILKPADAFGRYATHRHPDLSERLPDAGDPIHLSDCRISDYLLAARQLEQEHEMSYVTIAERHGMAKGRTEGEANLLLRQIQRRFGSVPDGIQQRVHAAQAHDLESWSLNILDAATLDDVFRAG